jgi:hypothetical protein
LWSAAASLDRNLPRQRSGFEWPLRPVAVAEIIREVAEQRFWDRLPVTSQYQPFGDTGER